VKLFDLGERLELMNPAQARRPAVNGPHLAALVWAGTISRNGPLVERDEMLTA
jgi:hypothetical protein